MQSNSAGLDIVGDDVVEGAPQYDATTNTAQVGAQMLFEILTPGRDIQAVRQEIAMRTPAAHQRSVSPQHRKLGVKAGN